MRACPLLITQLQYISTSFYVVTHRSGRVGLNQFELIFNLKKQLIQTTYEKIRSMYLLNILPRDKKLRNGHMFMCPDI